MREGEGRDGSEGPGRGGEVDHGREGPGRGGEVDHGREEPGLRAVAGLFLRLGLTAFGGPVAHVAMMHREAVRRRRWLDDRRFTDHLAMVNLIPGPNSTELAMILGRDAAGAKGLLVAGACFILPAALVVSALAWAYVRYGRTPSATALLYGVEPVVIAIVVQAIASLGRRVLATPLLVAIAATALALTLVGGDELLLLFGAGVAAVAVRGGRELARRGAHAVALLPLAAAAQAVREDVSLERLFLLLLKIGAVLYGSGYVLIAFLRGDLVEGTGWLTERQLLDAVSIGQLTPGPVFTTATFVGYVLAGPIGAAVATVAIFLPSFLFSALVGNLGPRLRGRRTTSDLLDGLVAGALGLMAAVVLQLGRHAIVDVPTAAIAAVGLAVLLRSELNSAWLVAAGAVAGLAVSALR